MAVQRRDISSLRADDVITRQMSYDPRHPLGCQAKGGDRQIGVAQQIKSLHDIPIIFTTAEVDEGRCAEPIAGVFITKSLDAGIILRSSSLNAQAIDRALIHL
ncbi:MAG: hypothetical protein ACXV2F_07020 [Halobacteriota archaeon]